MAEAESTDRPPLVAVDAKPAGDAPHPSASDESAPPGERWRWGLWALGALLIVFVLTSTVQSQRLAEAQGQVEVLTTQVAGLEGNLATANRQIQAFETQQAQVREAVTDLSQRLLALGAMVGAAPVAEPEAPAEPQP